MVLQLVILWNQKLLAFSELDQFAVKRVFYLLSYHFPRIKNDIHIHIFVFLEILTKFNVEKISPRDLKFYGVIKAMHQRNRAFPVYIYSFSAIFCSLIGASNEVKRSI